MNEILKIIIKSSLLSFGNLKSKQTGFIHYYSSNPHSDKHDTIPIYENLLYCLALFRSKNQENALDAISKIENLLQFQNKLNNFFPKYLHLYPEAEDYELQMNLLIVFFRIYDEFGKVLPSILKNHLKNIIGSLFEWAKSINDSKSIILNIYLGALLYRIGHYFEEKDSIEKGMALLDKMAPKKVLFYWSHPKKIEKILLALQFAYPFDISPSWNFFLTFIYQSYDVDKGCYCGPNLHASQFQYSYEKSLYHIYMSFFSNSYGEEPYNSIYGACIYPSNWKIDFDKNSSYLEMSLPNRWEYFKNTTVSGAVVTDEKENRTFFNIFWRGQKYAHSLSFQKSGVSLDWKFIDNLIELFIPIESDNEGDFIELPFFFDIDSQAMIQVGGKMKTTFSLNEEVTITSNFAKISVTFSLLEGCGDFMGHLLRGNRPQQKENKALLNAYDWIINLRPIRLQSKCMILAKIQYSKRVG